MDPGDVNAEAVSAEAVRAEAVNAPGDAIESDPTGIDTGLTVIEDLPLAERAAAYAQLYDQLRERLEGGDVPMSANG